MHLFQSGQVLSPHDGPGTSSQSRAGTDRKTQLLNMLKQSKEEAIYAAENLALRQKRKQIGEKNIQQLQETAAIASVLHECIESRLEENQRMLEKLLKAKDVLPVSTVNHDDGESSTTSLLQDFVSRFEQAITYTTSMVEKDTNEIKDIQAKRQDMARQLVTTTLW
ncbi:hypothetical protein CPB86DRAFT_114612 [Serendipita vermifera]|nr:hypothetical protein CPB86DRAFT_114612 [Serendipita vermifera]